MLALACAPAPKPSAGPAPLGLDGAGTYRHFLAMSSGGAKMRHQVETRFGSRSEIIEGFLILQPPDHFWVRALSPLGITLFDVRVTNPPELVFDVRIDELRDKPAPQYLARDIRRIYLRLCPATSPVEVSGDGFEVRCALPPDDTAIPLPDGDDPSDDGVAIHISSAGLLMKKQFSRGGQPTATAHYSDYKRLGDRWVAHRIELTHAMVSYELTVVLLSADLEFDTGRVFPKAPNGGAHGSPI